MSEGIDDAQRIAEFGSSSSGRAAENRVRVQQLGNDLRTAIEHHQAGRLDEAKALYRQMLDAAPNHPEALHLLGVIEAQRGRPKLGLELIGRALPALAKSPDVFIDLGNVLRLTGDRERALAAYRRAIALKPDNAAVHVSLAGVLRELGRFEAAVSYCQSAIAIDSTSLSPRITLAAALQGAGRLPEAAATWREIIALDPHRADSYHQLAWQLAALGLVKEAVYCTDRAITLEPRNAAYHCLRGHMLMRLYEGERAAANFREALALSPDLKDGWVGLNWALRMLGRFEEADQCLERLREIDPGDLRAIRHVPATGQQRRQPAEIERLSAVLDLLETNVEDRISAGFAVGKLLDEAGRYDEAFARYATVNVLVRENWPANTERFDAAAFARSVDALIKTNTTQLFAEAAATGNISELPVFIVGMPRSGTTLVEQICASHSRVYGAGELDDISRIALDLAAERRDQSRLAAASRRAADAHVLRLHRLGRGALRVVDKMPDNAVLVGLIARLFPRARIVYCRRDPLDIALSCYFQLFSEGAQYFSYDLADCGRRCRQVERLAAHWLSLLPLQMIEMNYEKLVADLEGESRRLIEFLGLDWEPACLNFHRTERTIATVSHWQVRQPIYTSSIGRWRHYEKHLGSLFAALDGN
jgi:tetratricopeptide (TPR) repeat protein